MTSAQADATKQNNLEIKENPSLVDEGHGTTRMITKVDGTKVPFSEENLRTSLTAQLNGLNTDFINIDIILQKVSSGLYNGKFISRVQRISHAPLSVRLSSLAPPKNFQRQFSLSSLYRTFSLIFCFL